MQCSPASVTCGHLDADPAPRRRCDADVTYFAEDVTRLAAELGAP